MGLSPEAVSDVEGILADAQLPSGALDGVLDFVVQSRIQTAATLAALQAILFSNRSDRIKLTAVSGLGRSPEGTAVLADNLNQLNGDIRRAAENQLLAAQHSPTIFRRLALLENDHALLVAGNVERHFNHPLEWIGQVRLWAGCWRMFVDSCRTRI